ncbi:MAG: HEAT repeat domain-containing protein [Anaerolineae bacterium]|nr:HEAT repeat domain-containing protein [Anaerolineae bacterium]
MLHGLDAIDWQNLKHNFGTAENLPDLLRQMLSDDSETRRQTFYELMDYICHQGTIVEATAPVVPFLIQLLAMEGFQDKADILGWFFAQLAPCPYWMYHHPPDLTIWDADVRQEVAKGLPVYLTLLNDPNARVRGRATAVLYQTVFPDDHILTIANALRQHIHDERDEDVRTVAVHGLGELSAGYCQFLADYLDDHVHLLQHLWQSEQGSVQYVAGSSLTKLLEDQTPEDILQRLIQGIAHKKRTRSSSGGMVTVKLGALPFHTENFEGIIAFWHLSLERRLYVYRDVLKQADSFNQAHYVAVTLLDNVFMGSRARTSGFILKPEGSKPAIAYQKSKQVRTLDALTPEQKQVVRLVLEADKVWEDPNNLLEMYGIFGSRERLRRKLGNS